MNNNRLFGHKQHVYQSTGCSPRRPLWLFASASLFLAGCSSLSATVPWMDNDLDPSRVATREPLEIPPDLTVLPKVDATTKPPAQKEKQESLLPWKVFAPSKATPTRQKTVVSPRHSSSEALPFPIPEIPGDEIPSRDRQEELPDWMK